MVKNHNHAKSINDASFNKICELLKWKTKIKGKYKYQVVKKRKNDKYKLVYNQFLY